PRSCWKGGPGRSHIGGDIVDGVLGNMRADIAARNIYLAVPVGALDVGLASRHVSQLCPSLRCRIPAPKVIEVLRGCVGATVDIDVGAVRGAAGAVTDGWAGRGGAPGSGRAGAGKHRLQQILDHA